MQLNSINHGNSVFLVLHTPVSCVKRIIEEMDFPQEGSTVLPANYAAEYFSKVWSWGNWKEINKNVFLQPVSVYDWQQILCLDVNLYWYNFYHYIFFRLSEQQDKNKMSIQNLATVFGPTLLRPAAKTTEQTTMDLFSAGARDAMMQTSILYFFLTLRVQLADFRK